MVEAAPLTITHDWLLENDIDIVIVATEGGVPAVDQYNQAAEDQYDGIILNDILETVPWCGVGYGHVPSQH